MTESLHWHPSPVHSSSSSHFNCPVRSAVEPPGSLCAHLQSNPARTWVLLVRSYWFKKKKDVFWVYLRRRYRKRTCAWSSSAGKSLHSCIQGPPRASRHRWDTPGIKTQQVKMWAPRDVDTRSEFPTTWRASRAWREVQCSTRPSWSKFGQLQYGQVKV